jgi:hypothetical protein
VILRLSVFDLFRAHVSDAHRPQHNTPNTNATKQNKTDMSNATVPGTRNETHDFVREGARIPAGTVAFVRARRVAFSAAVPAYPADAFAGRGIVTVGGGMRYIVPAWIMVHQLRHAGAF